MNSLRIYVRGDRKCVMTTAIVPVVYRLVKYIAMLCPVYTVCSTVAESRETVPRRSIDRRRVLRIFFGCVVATNRTLYTKSIKINTVTGCELRGRERILLILFSFHAEREFRVRTNAGYTLLYWYRGDRGNY